MAWQPSILDFGGWPAGLGRGYRSKTKLDSAESRDCGFCARVEDWPWVIDALRTTRSTLFTPGLRGRDFGEIGPALIGPKVLAGLAETL